MLSLMVWLLALMGVLLLLGICLFILGAIIIGVGTFIGNVSGKENTFTKYYDKRNSMW